MRHFWLSDVSLEYNFLSPGADSLAVLWCVLVGFLLLYSAGQSKVWTSSDQSPGKWIPLLMRGGKAMLSSFAWTGLKVAIFIILSPALEEHVLLTFHSCLWLFFLRVLIPGQVVQQLQAIPSVSLNKIILLF